jgi:hypothetical protein
MNKKIYELKANWQTKVYKYLNINFEGNQLLIALQKEIPECIKDIPNLYGVYSFSDIFYSKFSHNFSIKLSDTMEDEEIKKLIHGEVWKLINYDFSIISYPGNLANTIKYRYKKDKKGENHYGTISYFGKGNTVFLYNSMERSKLDLLVLFVMLLKLNTPAIKNFVVHLPNNDYEYEDTYWNHIANLEFNVLFEYENNNSGNTVAILKKSLV